MPRMRTATGALEIIKQQDPDTAVTLHYIRQLISSGKVPFVPVGRKKLINVDELLGCYIFNRQNRGSCSDLIEIKIHFGFPFL